jgi:hypothetical protein
VEATHAIRAVIPFSRPPKKLILPKPLMVSRFWFWLFSVEMMDLASDDERKFFDFSEILRGKPVQAEMKNMEIKRTV